MDNRRLKLQAGMSSIHSVIEREDIDGPWLDVLGECRLSFCTVRRAIFPNGDVLEWCSARRGWFIVDLSRSSLDNGARSWASIIQAV